MTNLLWACLNPRWRNLGASGGFGGWSGASQGRKVMTTLCGESDFLRLKSPPYVARFNEYL
jgi:hypothetical protein